MSTTCSTTATSRCPATASPGSAPSRACGPLCNTRNAWQSPGTRHPRTFAMSFNSLLIANRGEIAVRIARAASDLGIRTVAIYSDDDAQSAHVRAAATAQALGASGPAPYLDIARVVAAAKAAHCEAVHPGYGFLSENAEFAKACESFGLTFLGPSPNA